MALEVCPGGTSICFADTDEDAAVAPTSLVISEVMYNPNPDVDFPLGQWFEVYNPTDQAVTLAGVMIEVLDADGTSGQGVVIEWGEAPVVPGNGFNVLGAAKPFAENGGVNVDFGYGEGIALPKQGGTLRLTFEGELLDEIVFGPFSGLSVAPGVSINLEPVGMTPEANDEIGYWCESEHDVEGSLVPMTGSPGQEGHYCDSDHDGYDEISGDCDDFDPKRSPTAKEKCNGIDDDCDGEVDDEPLTDMPVWGGGGVCEAGGPVCLGEEGWDFVYPEGWEENEATCDGWDNDCDGETDENLLNDCGECGPAPDEVCDGWDNDCDGLVDEGQIEPPDKFQCQGAGAGICKEFVPQCIDGKWLCEPAVGWQSEETWCDQIDNDCDGETDEGYELGAPCAVGQGACRNSGELVCAPDKLSLVCEATEDMGLIELCGDNLDNDCDGETDEDFPVGEACEKGTGACRVSGKYFCTTDKLDVLCLAEPLPPVDEICLNDLDDDCDGATDEVECDGSLPEAAPGCGAAGNLNSGLTILLMLFIPLLALILHRRRERAPL